MIPVFIFLLFINLALLIIKTIRKKDYVLIGLIISYFYTLSATIYFYINPVYSNLFVHIGIAMILVSETVYYLSYYINKKQMIRLNYAQALKQLAAITDKYQTIIENSPIGFYVIDEVGRLEYANSFAHNLLGYSMGELIGKNIFDYIEPRDHREVKDNIQKRLRDNVKTVDYCIHMRKKEGNYIKVRIIGSKTTNGHITFTGSMIAVAE